MKPSTEPAAAPRVATADRPLAPRYRTTRFVWLRALRTGEAASREQLCFSADVSRSGVGLMTSEPLEAGAEVFLRVVFQEQRGDVTALCRVVYCNEQRGSSCFRVGLEFVLVPPDCRRFLNESFP